MAVEERFLWLWDLTWAACLQNAVAYELVMS